MKKTAVFDNSKSRKELGLEYRSLETILIDQTDQLERDGMV